jgi:hypothetical protein
MDILASIFAYLGCVTGILGAAAISFFVLFSPPDPATIPAPTAMMAKTSAAKAVATAAATPAPKITQIAVNPASSGPKRDSIPQSTIGRTASANDVRHKPHVAAAQVRRLEQEQRARRWAYQQDPDFEARFLGYAD